MRGQPISPSSPMSYRLALDLGPSSLGWALLRLQTTSSTQPPQPCAIIKAGVRIFSDGRNPKDGTSLAVTRREARSMRRRRDRLLKRKNRMMRLLVQYGFFPQEPMQRKQLESKNPYELRAKGLDAALKPGEFARALFHINQRRGFQSNRKTDNKENDAGAMKSAIKEIKSQLYSNQPGSFRTVGELLWHKLESGNSVRARYRQKTITTDEGKKRIEKSYDLYIERAMIKAEFDALWAKQSALNPALFHEKARLALRDCLLHQRPLKPVDPGRCTLLPDEKRAALALPSTQRFRLYQEVNNLRILGESLQPIALTLEQRNILIEALENNAKLTFTKMARLLKLPSDTQFNLQDVKRQELKGNATSSILKKDDYFGKAWFTFDEALQDEIVQNLVQVESEEVLVAWLCRHTAVDEVHAQTIANARLPEGYGSLSAKALALILPELRKEVIPYAQAAKNAGFHHSQLSSNTEIPGRTFTQELTNPSTGEIKTLHIFKQLPYYGEYLQRHVGFGTGNQKDPAEKRFGRIANPSVHIGLNQIRTVVNALIAHYGHPQEVVIEVARELKQNREQKMNAQREQATNQKRNANFRAEIAKIQNIPEHSVKHVDIQKMILWTELNPYDPLDRRCPYSGEQINLDTLLSDKVEIDHILPFSQTLDDGMSNKTVALRKANRIKRNRNPWQASADFAREGWDVSNMMQRVMFMAKNKRYRFGENAMETWLHDEKDFLARALNDTRYLSRIAREYLALICPQATRVIPGQMTALLRQKFGLNDILGLKGEKNRNDHRHHAVDACVIGVTDQGLLQRFAQASASAQEKDLERLVETMPLPWPTYYQHVQRAINGIKISHRPDHGHEGAMHNDTAYGILDNGLVHVHKTDENGQRLDIEEKLNVIEISAPQAMALHGLRHGTLPDGSPRPYKGYKGDSNYCMDIACDDKGKWSSRVISTFEVYQFVRKHGIEQLMQLRQSNTGFDGKPLIMRLMRNDCIKLEKDGKMQLMRVTTIKSNGTLSLAPLHEANVDARNRSKEDTFSYTYKTAGTLYKAKGRRVTVSPIGIVSAPGFKA